jgi:twinkle protein
MKLLNDSTDFDSYFREQVDEGAKIRPASEWCQGVIDRLYGDGAPNNWTPTGFDKMQGKFDLRKGEVTVWAGINKHGKTTFLSHVMLNVMKAGQKVCVASLEMNPTDSMTKMARQAAGVESPAIPYIKAFHRWTDGKLWIYDHVGKLSANRALAVATYVRKELGLDHLVIDSLMKCGIGVDDLTGQKDFIDSLCAIARDTGLGIHLVCHMRKGESDKTAPGKFDVKGAGEITDMVDNIVIVWRNQRKTDKKADNASEPDSYVRIAGQRHHPFEGSFAFWFDPASQQYLEHQSLRPSYIDLQPLREAA